MEPAELFDISVDREVFGLLLKFLSSQHSLVEKRVHKRMNE